MIYSVGIVAVYYAVIMLASFIICRVGVSTEYTFSWGITWFIAIAGFMLAAGFYAGIWLVTVSLCVSIMLASSALWYVGACARRLKLDNSVLDGCQVVDFLVIFCRF